MEILCTFQVEFYNMIYKNKIIVANNEIISKIVFFSSKISIIDLIIEIESSLNCQIHQGGSKRNKNWLKYLKLFENHAENIIFSNRYLKCLHICLGSSQSPFDIEQYIECFFVSELA